MPLLVLLLLQLVDFQITMVLLAVGAIAIPVFAFNYSKVLALALYYFFMPAELYHPEIQDKI